MKAVRTILCTGGIGSGKSCIVKAFETMGIPSYDCDSAAKRLYDEDPLLSAEITRIAGPDIIVDGKIDRKALAGKIFGDEEMLRKVEDAVHPAVVRDFERWKMSQNSGIVLIESAIMLMKPLLAAIPDYVLEVTASEDVRISRVMARDDCSAEEVERRMDSQRSVPLRKADFVIETDDRHDVLPVIIEIINTIENNGKDRS